MQGKPDLLIWQHAGECKKYFNQKTFVGKSALLVLSHTYDPLYRFAPSSYCHLISSLKSATRMAMESVL